MKAILLASVAIGFMSETCETVTVGGVRVNKDDYEADQLKPAGERQYGKIDSKADTEQSVAGTAIPRPESPPVAAPSAPHFGGPEGEQTVPIDPLKQAAAPVVQGENFRGVIKDGKSYAVVDGQGNKLSKDDLGGVDNKFTTEELAWNAIRALPH